MKKRILSVLLVLVMLFGMLPTAALAADTDVPTSGTCGDSATWSYDADTKTLTISGTGATSDYGSTVAKAPPYADSSIYPIEHFVVSEGITKIGKYALTSYVKSGTTAKPNNTVVDIQLPDSLTEVATYAIYNNDALKSLTFPKNVTSFSTTGYIIYKCAALEEIKFEGNVTEIGRLYRGLAALKSAIVPAGTKAIVSNAFDGCKSLTELFIPDSVELINSRAFSNCSGIKELEMPASINSFGADVFYGWTPSQTILFREGFSRETIDSFSAGWCGNATVKLGSLDITPTSGPCGDNAVWSYDAENKTMTISGTGAVKNYGSTVPVWGAGGERYAGVERLVVESGITRIGNAVFKSADFAAALKSISLPGTLEEIGQFAFDGLTGVESIQIPESVKKIEASVFNGWTDAQTIRFAWPENLAAENISFDANWLSGCNAKVEYLQIDDAYCEGITITLKDGEKSYQGTLDLASLKISFTDEVDILMDVSFSDPEIIVTKNGQPWTDGTATLSGALTFANAGSGRYTTGTKLTITPAEGVKGSAFSLSMSLTVTEKAYEFQGSGTEDDPYIVDSALALYHLSKGVNGTWKYANGKYYLQTADIDMSGIDWKPIGKTSNRGEPDNNYSFGGTYDGGNYRIKNLTVNNTDSTNYAVGLFGSVKKGTIRNVVMDKSSSFRAAGYVGGIVGSAYTATIENCVNEADAYGTGTIKGNYSSRAYVGGIIGYPSYDVTILNCKNYGAISTDANGEECGGISGGEAETIINCHNYGSVFGGRYIGGVASGISKGVMIGCSNHGSVSSSYAASSMAANLDQAVGSTGGLVGWVMQGSVVEGCYNAGTVSVDWPGAGGLAGDVSSDVVINNCYTTGGVYSTYTGEWSTAAGSVFGHIKPVNNSTHSFDNLFFLDQGLAAIGANEALDNFAQPVGKSAEDLKSDGFLQTLRTFFPQELTVTNWDADSANQNNGYPVITGVTERLDYHKQLTKFTVGSLTMTIDEAAATVTGMVTNDADLSALAPQLTISANATVSPASGEAVDFTKGPVTYTVTAQDGTTKAYTVTLTKADSPLGLMAFQLQGDYAGTGLEKKLLLPASEFDQKTLVYNIDCRDGVIDTQVDAWVIPAVADSTVTVAVNGGDPAAVRVSDSLNASGTFVRCFDTLHQGKNTLEFVVTPPADSTVESVTYTVNLNLRPSLHDMTVSGTGVKVSPNDYKKSQSVTDYTLTLEPDVETVNLSFTAYGAPESTIVTGPVEFTNSLKNAARNQYQYTAVVPVTQTMDSFAVTVACADESIPSTTYTFHIAWNNGYSARIETNVTGASIRIADPDGNAVTPDGEGAYLLTRGKTYTYTVVAKGYKSQSGTVTGPESLTDGKLVLNLEAVESGSLPQLDAAWPSFRGNDNHMAITSAPTPRSADEAELLWGVAAGVGFDSGAVSSPIIVDGYLYAYAGKSLLKIDRSNGSVAASGTMVDSSNFAIVPPTYADGMIFVGLSKGRVQAFNAQTLESLWVYTDPLGGQPNSPIVYHDGCVYTGFWNSETRNANFVCLTVDDEDTANTTEAKQALWTYTQAGGFYWAGAFAKGQYIVVGTDDGQSGYTSATARLLVLDKDTGALVSSATGYTGDIRSNVSYDADSDRVYFTSKGGYFYSEMIDWSTGLIDASESRAIALGGMSTSTPVVYQGRGYVGVAGTSQFGAYSGHHIAVLDLDQWTVAYTAASQGYPQTSGMLTTAYAQEDGYVYVYFMDNYTPGVMRVIKDSAGQTELLDGVTENGHENCAPVVFTPEGKLAQYCICSPIADENGVIYFKNDSGYMMAVGRGQVEKNYTVTFDAQGGTADAETLETSGGVLAQLPEARKPGFTFLGWFTQAENGEQVTTETVFTQDTTLYAHWQAVEGYTVSVGQGSSIVVGESANLTLTLRNAAETTYNAYHFVLTYDPAVLDYTGINTDATVKNENGTLTVSGYGQDRACGTDDIVLTFAAKAPGKSDVTLTGANVDKSANAVTQDAPEASVDPASAVITVGGYTVTLPEDFTGAAAVNEGEDYTFTAKDTHYDYTFGGSTMGGEDVTVIDNGDGTFTVKNVTGDIVIRSEKTPKQYAVTVEGTGASDTEAPATATYGVDYGFNVNENAAYTYTVSATVDGAPAALVNNGSGSYTISGASVTGSIVITVEKTAKPVTTTQITFVGEGSADVVGGTTQTAPNGTDFRFELNKAEGYDYTVKLDGTEMVPEEDGSYVIPGSMLTGAAVTVTVEKTAQQSITLEVSEYIRLDGTTMWLVTASGTVSQDKTLAYDGTPMFWSDKYQAYAYLVISEKIADEVKADAAEKIAEAAAERTDILYDFDVNATGLVDINDAQLVYDMYNAKFASFDLVPMARFLRADCNGDKTVSTLDAAAIVNHLLNG